MRARDRLAVVSVARVADGYTSDSAFVAGLLLAAGLVMTVLSLCLLNGMGQTLDYCAQWVCG